MSDVMMAGTPHLQIHPENNAGATSAVAMLARGSASIKQLILSTYCITVIKSIGGCEGAYQFKLMWENRC